MHKAAKLQCCTPETYIIKMGVCVCKREREVHCVCVSVRERGALCVREVHCVCVFVCEREVHCVCLCVCVCVGAAGGGKASLQADPTFLSVLPSCHPSSLLS